MWNDTYWQLEAANTPWAAAFSDMEQKKNLVHVFTVELIAFTTLQGFNNVNKKKKINKEDISRIWKVFNRQVIQCCLLLYIKIYACTHLALVDIYLSIISFLYVVAAPH